MPDESPYDQPSDKPDGTPGEKKPLGENLKQRLDELEVEKHLHQLVDEAEKVAAEAVERAGGMAYERRDDVAGWLDKATGAVNEKTKGQYADKVDKVREGVLAGLDKLASRRHVGDPIAPIEAPGSPESSAPPESSESPGSAGGPASGADPDQPPQPPTAPPMS